MADQRFSKQSDIPLPLALVLLGAVVAFISIPDPLTTAPFILREVQRYLQRHEAFAFATGGTIFLNLLFASAVLPRTLGLRAQGSRLNILTGGASKRSGVSAKTLIPAAFAAAVVLIWPSPAWLTTEIAALPFLSPGLRDSAGWAVRLNFGGSTFAVVFVLAQFRLWSWMRSILGSRLPDFPAVKNGLVLGSVDEDLPQGSPSWAVLGNRALNGNIIVTGSIGTGKTQGAILPYLDQFLVNFTPRPALLAIDPKSTFISEALKIIERRGHGEHVIHLKLGGTATFNPIYHPNALKGAAFLDVAQMIRAAAVNFMGKSFDSPFWETSATNLVKYCLVYCAATKGYYTLNDLYSTMVRAVSEDAEFCKELEACLADDRFTDEEKRNIGFALQYFAAEYRQLEDKVRTGILATSTSFLNQFQEYQASQIFCPAKDKLTIPSMDDVVDKGKLLLFDVRSPGLARSMGTFIKLHYEQSILNRMKDPRRSKERPAVLVIDEYQDVVTTGYGSSLGDERFLAQSREANAISLMATQSLSSLENSIGREKPTHELWLGFRTKLLAQTTDLATIRAFQEIVGREDRKRVSHSVSEYAQHASRNLLLGGFEAKDANISESVSTAETQEYAVTGRELSRLNSFECFAMIYDGVGSVFKKVFWKPYYLAKRTTAHSKVISGLRAAAVATSVALLPHVAFAFPNVCTVVKSSEFRSCLDFNVGMCMCGWPIPRPCTEFTYYVPRTFVEVWPEPGSSYFSALPGAAIQLSTLPKTSVPYGVESDDATHAFHAHALSVPFMSIPFNTLPCRSFDNIERFCFEGMSEHLGSQWNTGDGDLLQPSFLAWQLSPKGCLLKGALTSSTGESGPGFYPSAPTCSVPMSWLPRFPPSSHSTCTGWGVFFPRSGVVNGPSQTTGALMVASRMKSLASEVFHSTPSSADEVWQMIYPQTSSCFREGQNVGVLETLKGVRETGRLTSGRPTGYLFVVWHKVSCCRDIVEVPSAFLLIEAMKAACEGIGA